MSGIIYLKTITREMLRQEPEARFVFGTTCDGLASVVRLGKCVANPTPSAS